jgi:hypothetical protein
VDLAELPVDSIIKKPPQEVLLPGGLL